MITALGGGVGAAKFLKGLYAVVQPGELNIIVNTADDIDIYGFRVSPDIDTVIYRLSDRIDQKKGWGLRDDTYNCLDTLSELGYQTWFGLGDKDFAVQIYKQRLREQGIPDSGITERLASRFNIKGVTILPMSDDHVETWIKTDEEIVHFQEYYIKLSMSPPVRDVVFKGISEARPAPGVVESIMQSDIVLICPSNPIISIGPILEVEGVKQALIETDASIAAVSPLIGGRPIKGPADRLMRGLGMEVSSAQIAGIYKEFLDVMIIDKTDKGEQDNIQKLGIKTVNTDTIMSNDSKSEQLSTFILECLDYN